MTKCVQLLLVTNGENVLLMYVPLAFVFTETTLFEMEGSVKFNITYWSSCNVFVLMTMKFYVIE